MELTVVRRKAAKAVHFGETVREDTREGRRHGSNQVENSIALLEVEAWIPAAQEVRTRREEASFENAED